MFLLWGGIEVSKNTVTKEQIEKIMLNAVIDIQTVGNKTTIVHCVLPNGFVIVESSSCVDPENYDEKIGAEICLKRIENKVWELEGYVLQNFIYLQNEVGIVTEENEGKCVPTPAHEEGLYVLFEALRSLDKEVDHDTRESVKRKLAEKLNI